MTVVILAKAVLSLEEDPTQNFPPTQNFKILSLERPWSPHVCCGTTPSITREDYSLRRLHVQRNYALQHIQPANMC